MNLNKKLTISEKLKLFKNIPLAKMGAVAFLMGMFMVMLVALQKPDIFFQKPEILILFIFPVVGLLLMFPAIKAFPRIINAIENGVCVEGELLEFKTTGTKVGNQPLVKMKIGYELYGQQYTCEERVIGPSRNIQKYLLLVDADKPNNAVYVETLPVDLKMEVIRRNKIA